VSGAPLVTGGGGFAGRHLVARLRELGDEPFAPSRSELDLLDAEAVRATVADLRPRAVFHLAAIASVPRSWEAPAEPLLDNLAMTLSLLEAVRLEAAEAAVVVASSGEVYGLPERLPLDEEAPLRPQNPYAVSKAACDLLAGQYADAHGLRVVRARAFNHAGPGQSDDYVVGTLTCQAARAELEGRSEVTLRVGNLESARDFTDVRDVARAYVAASGVPAGAYNVCSGRAVSVRELIDVLRRVAKVEVRSEVDAERMRGHDVPEIRGSAERLRAATGWGPEIPLEHTLRDALAAWRERLAATR
jgi:GDP-4-dehydro-6-deoxy-D-mannose reductase